MGMKIWAIQKVHPSEASKGFPDRVFYAFHGSVILIRFMSRRMHSATRRQVPRTVFTPTI
jgi:hypothetical protein